MLCQRPWQPKGELVSYYTRNENEACFTHSKDNLQLISPLITSANEFMQVRLKALRQVSAVPNCTLLFAHVSAVHSCGTQILTFVVFIPTICKRRVIMSIHHIGNRYMFANSWILFAAWMVRQFLSIEINHKNGILLKLWHKSSCAHNLKVCGKAQCIFKYPSR